MRSLPCALQALTDRLLDWLAALHLRVPHATVILVGTHKDKCVPRKAHAAWLRPSKPIEDSLKEIELSLTKKHEQWMKDRRGGAVIRSIDETLTLEKGIHLVSSSPSSRASGLFELQDLLRKHTPSKRSRIPPSWGLALVVLGALRAGIDPMAAAVGHINRTDPPEPTSPPRNWITMGEIEDRWNQIQGDPGLAGEFRAADSAFALESALDLRWVPDELFLGCFVDIKRWLA